MKAVLFSCDVRLSGCEAESGVERGSRPEPGLGGSFLHVAMFQGGKELLQISNLNLACQAKMKEYLSRQ